MLQIGTRREYLSHTSVPVYTGSRIAMLEDLTLVRHPTSVNTIVVTDSHFLSSSSCTIRNFIYNSPKKGFLAVLQMVYISKMFVYGRILPYYFWHQLLRK